MANVWVRRRQMRQRLRRPASILSRPLGLSLIMLALAIGGAMFLMTATVTSAVAAYSFFSRDLPSPERLANREFAKSTFIYDRNGKLLYEIFDPRYGRRHYVTLPEISPYLVQATIATEDADFYSNNGINFRGIARAAAVMLRLSDDNDVQGGSSITQQLVKNVLIPEEERSQRLLSRKIKEMIMAGTLTQRYSKDQILEWYLNENNYGNLSYGIETAARTYFAKTARDLTLAEASMLAGVPQLPAVLSPLVSVERAKERQKQVLTLMVRHGYITESEANDAYATELVYKTAKYSIEAPHFVMYVRDKLIEKYGQAAVLRGGLRVTTSIDLDLQNKVQELARQHIETYGPRFNANNASVVCIDPGTGEVLAMVGSIDYFEAKNQGQVNMAVAERQPGSSFKPITYLNAFLKGWSPATMVSDTPLRFVDELGRPWNPVNNDKIFRGMVPVRSALATSLNIPAARAILYAGVEPTLDLAHRMGITTLTRKGWYGPSLTLGGGEVRPLDLAFAYTVLANNGKLRGQLLPPGRQQPGFAELEPVTILKIEDSAGEVLEQFTHPEERQVVEAPYAYLVTDIMSDNDARTPAYGRNNSLILPDRPVAAKTGTTDSNQDNWTLGFTPNLVTAVWIGNTDNARMNAQALGGANAAPLWQAVMKAYHEGKPVERFVRPPGVVTAQVCAATGLLASSGCSVRRNEIFVAGRLPTRQPDQAMLVKYDKTTGKPATPETPPENIEERLQAPGEEGAGAGGAAVPGAVPGQPGAPPVAPGAVPARPGAPASVPGLPDGWALPTPQTGVLQRPPGDIRTP